jgi:Glycoside Hydrolase Family 113/FG-GAP-like repeat
MRPIVLLVCIAMMIALGGARAAAQAVAKNPSTPLALTYQGFNYVSYYNGAYENADSLPALAATGANAAALDIEYGIDVVHSTVYADATYTDSLSALAATTTEATGRGLVVMIRPLIDFLDPAKIGTYGVGDWRSFYNPTDPGAFFASYKAMILSVAQVAQANGAAILCIGAELDQLAGPAYLSYWTDIITSVRTVFSGKLTYSANWDAALSPWQGQHGLGAGTGDLATQVSFWSELDFIGIDCYAPLSDAVSPVLADLIAGWTQVPSDPTSLAVTGNQSLISYFGNVASRVGEPLLFTEIGYESANDAARQPAGTSTNLYDPALQANLYAAFFDAWQQSGSDVLTGVFFWNWDPNAAEVGPGNGPNFSPQALPAQRVVTAAFAKRPVNTVLTVTHDFNGNGYSNVAWRNSNGDTSIWLMNSTTVVNQNSSFVANVLGQWVIVGQRDFNSDGSADLLWRDTSGNVAIWEMNGTAVLNQNRSFVANVATNWSVAGTGDFNGDGMGDLLWQDMSGNVAIWEMNGTTVLNQNSSFVANVAGQWSIKGIGDFNGDGMSDILWQDSSGNVAIWEMNGTAVLNTNTSFVSNVPSQWSIQLTGDFNADGTSDILWQDTSGNVAMWEMNGTSVLNASSSFVSNVPGPWSIQNLGAE